MTVATPGFASTSLKQPSAARLAGLLYLIVIACGLFGVGFVQGSLVVRGDAAATANNIIASESLYRLGFAAQLVMYACYAAVTAIFYDLFRPVSRGVSLFALSFSLAGIAVGAAGMLNGAAPWLLLGGADYLDVFTTDQLQALAFAFLRLDSVGFSISLVFFGIYMIAIGGLCHLIYHFAGFLSPPLAAQLSAYTSLPGLVAVLLLALWLVLAVVNGSQWQAQTGAAEG